MNQKRVLVTGAAGFLGRHLIEELVGHDVRISALVRPGGSTLPTSLAARVNQFEVDLRQPGLSADYFQGVDTVYHLAGKYLPGNADALLRELRRWNVDCTRHVVAASLKAGVKRFIHISSAAACEFSKNELVEEDTGTPVSAYGISKKESEDLLKEVSPEKLAWTILRPTAIFGEYRSSPITEIAKAIQSGRYVIFGKGGNFVNFIYVKDVVSAIILSENMKNTYGKIYLLADDPVRFSELSDSIRKAMGIAGATLKIPAIIGYGAAAVCDIVSLLTRKSLPLSIRRIRFMTQSVIYSNSRLRADTGFEPVYGIDEGIKRTLRWYNKVLP